VRLTKLPQFWCLEKNLNERGDVISRGSGNGKDWVKRIPPVGLFFFHFPSVR